MQKSAFIPRALLAISLSLIAVEVDGATLRVLTYNIHHGVGEDNALNLSRIASVINAANPDVVSLQEVDNDVPRSNNVNQVSRLAELTGMQWYFGKARNLDGGGYGNGVLVRTGIDIVTTQNFALPNPDDGEPRAVARLGLSLDSNPDTAEFNFFATHLDHMSPSARQDSATFINNLVTSSATPSILAGDMNFKPDSVAFNIIDNQWDDATNTANPGINRANQIDYVFYRSAAQWDVTTGGQFIRNATTEVASDHYPLLAVLELTQVWPGSALVWNDNSGAAASFNEGFATGNGSGAVGDAPANPWSSQYNTGTQNLLVGYNGIATVSGNNPRTVGSMRIGTDEAHAIIAGRNGNGAVSVSGTMNLTVASTTGSTGDLHLGEGGYTGTMTWSSSGTLDAQGRLRVGQGGTGVFNQTNGVVVSGIADGSLRFLGIGVDPGSAGTYNLNAGSLRPGGGFAANQFRQTLVGDNDATGTLNVGDNVGSANSAVFESNDDVVIGRDGGNGTLRVRSDGRVELRTTVNQAELFVGENGVGAVVQTGGTVTSDSTVRIGGGTTGTGLYAISGGVLATGVDGSGTFQIARGGANGTLRIAGNATFSHGAELFIATDTNTGSTGRVEVAGSQASVAIGQIGNVVGGTLGMSETIRWEADANGVTPICVSGVGGISGNSVQLQNFAELAANTNGGGVLRGDGVALELDLSAFSNSAVLTLVENNTSNPVQGFFESGTSGELYAEGAPISGTGFRGAVRVSYAGGTGNDVVLRLVSSTDLGDLNGDGIVDAADYVAWRKSGVAGMPAYNAWQANFGTRWSESPASASSLSNQVPEPPNAWLILVAFVSAILSYVRYTPRRHAAA